MVRKAQAKDLSRVAEIFVFNNRVNYLPIFGDPGYSFGEMQVLPMAAYFGEEAVLNNLYVFDDGLVKGFLQVDETEICKLYVDAFFQNAGVGKTLLEYAFNAFNSSHLWALEKNERAIAFYAKHDFRPSGERRFEEGTTEYLLHLVR